MILMPAWLAHLKPYFTHSVTFKPYGSYAYMPCTPQT